MSNRYLCISNVTPARYSGQMEPGIDQSSAVWVHDMMLSDRSYIHVNHVFKDKSWSNVEINHCVRRGDTGTGRRAKLGGAAEDDHMSLLELSQFKDTSQSKGIQEGQFSRARYATGGFDSSVARWRGGTPPQRAPRCMQVSRV